jgi:N-acetylmuramoyl-L-alanine amidase
MVPAREVWEALGAYTWLSPEKNTLYVCSELRGVSVSQENHRFVLHLDCSLPVDYHVYTLSGPPRLVIDLPATKFKANPSSFAVASQAISRIRAAQTSKEPFATRVVADLIGEQEHEVTSPQGVAKVSIRIGGKFDPWPLPPLPSINSVAFSQDNEEQASVRVAGDPGLSQFSTFALNDPLRIVVDIPEAILHTDGRSIRTNNPAIKEIRFSQFSMAPFVVRVVAVLDEPRPFFFELKDGLTIRFSLRPGQGIVAIDPGHGGPDSGAVGNSATQEKDVNLDVALRLADLLMEEGIKPLLTRSTDTYVSLDDRCNLANALGADIFVSLHCNASPSRNRRKGLETYYFHPRGDELAATVHHTLIRQLDWQDNGVRVARFVVVRRTAMPAILVEMGYINHYEDEARLRSLDSRQKIAEALKDGILEYMRLHRLGPWSTEGGD